MPGLVPESYGKWGPRSAPQSATVRLLPRPGGGARVPLPAGLLGGCQHRLLFTSWALRMQREEGPECQRFDMGQGASSNLLAQFWEPKKVLSVLMGTLGLFTQLASRYQLCQLLPLRVLLATTPGQPHPALSVPGPSPGEQRPLSQLPATPPHLWRTGWSHRMARRAPFQWLSLLARHPQMCEGAWQEPGVGPFERRWAESRGTGLPGSGVPSTTFQSRCQ